MSVIRRAIAAHYLRTWFLIDLVSVLPLGACAQQQQQQRDPLKHEYSLVVRDSAAHSPTPALSACVPPFADLILGGHGDLSKVARIARTTRLLRLLRMLKLLKYVRGEARG